MKGKDVSRLKLGFILLLSISYVTANGAGLSPEQIGNGLIRFAVTVVILVVALFYFLFKVHGYFVLRRARAAQKVQESEKKIVTTESTSGEVNAAIAMALFLYSEQLHDIEDPIITMSKVSRTYSPWSSKIYGLRKSPR